MPIERCKPTTPGRRGMTSLSYEEITADKPEKSLLKPLRSKSEHNNNRRITIRHQGGGHKRACRVIDFKRGKDGIPARVATIGYDPNHPVSIILLSYADGEKHYIIAPKGLTVGMNIVSGGGTDIKIGDTMELKDIPEGTSVHNIKLRLGKGGQLARSTSASVQVLGVEEKYITVRLASGEVRKILSNYRATIGQVGGKDRSLVNYGKAGRMRWKGVRPTVRGSVMNPDDHPHDDGGGRTPVGRKSPMTPWGKKAMGVKAHKAKKASTKLIVRRRNGR